MSANPYARVGVVDPNYSTTILPQLREYLTKGAQFNAYNSADRLSGWFIGNFTSSHVRSEVPKLRISLADKATRSAVDSYIDHLKVVGDGIVSALATYKVDTNGDRRAVAGEIGQFCNFLNVLATTACVNYGFIHTSARSHVYHCSSHNQQTDTFQAGSKFFWFRAEKHFQIQAATSSVYVTSTAEDFYKRHFYRAAEYKANVKSFQLNGLEYVLDSERIHLAGKKIELTPTETLNVNTKKLAVNSSQTLSIASSSTITISGSQIFLGRLASAPPPPVSEVPIGLEVVEIEDLPTYPRGITVANQKLPVVNYGSQQFTVPPI